MAGTVVEKLDLLAQTLGSERKASAFVGVSHTQFGAWRAGAAPSARLLIRIGDGVTVIDRLRERGLGQIEIRNELHAIWPEIDERPGVRIVAGETQAVLDAIDVRHGGHAVVAEIEPPADLVAALRMLAVAAAASADALAKAAP